MKASFTRGPFLSVLLGLTLFGPSLSPAGAASPAQTLPNLARGAQATASESQGNLTPHQAIDGRRRTRWSGIPGHNEGVWYQLDWKEPVEVGEVIFNQFDTYVIECDVQVRSDNDGPWETVRHLGQPNERLPRTVICRFAPRKVTGLRIANISGGPSFNEVIVHAQPFAGGTATVMASDLRGNFVGIVTDAAGSAPLEGASVTLSGAGRGGAWKSTSRTDDHGMFFAPMPPGLAGQIHVHTQCTVDGLTAPPSESQLAAVQFVGRPTPRHARQNAVPLAGRWRFALDPPDGFWRDDFDDAGWAEIRVPAHWEMEGFHNDSGIGGYRRRFQAPAAGGRLKLAFEGVYSRAEVWVNGQLIAIHEGGFTPFEADVTDVVRPGENLLAVRVHQHTVVSDRLDKMSVYADFPLAGIMRPVYLFSVPPTHVAGLEITPAFDGDYRGAALRVRACVVNESPQPFRGQLDLRLDESAPKQTPNSPPGTAVASARPAAVTIAPWQAAEVEFSLPVARPKTWTAEHPNLYALSLALRQDRTVVQQFATPTGFRQTDVRGSELLINGRPVKLRGTCHHDQHPMRGRAVDAEHTLKDLLQIKGANLNALRTSHYPPVPELLDLADELGVYVEDEASFCWARDAEMDDLRNTPRIVQLTAELLARDRNHPSVIFWSLCNESHFGYGFQRSHDWVRRADRSRPTSAGLSAWLDIATLHNPMNLARIKENERLDQPLLFDESLGIFQGIFRDVAELWVDPGMRDYYVEPLLAVYDAFMKSKVTQGTFIWCWADDIFCVPGRGLEYGRNATQCHFLENSYRVAGRGITGDAPWGVVDGWRREKPEYWITKKLHSPVKVKEGPLPSPAPGQPLRIAVENQYDFTNLSELTIRWRIGNDRGLARTDVPPRTLGHITIPYPNPANPTNPSRDRQGAGAAQPNAPFLELRFEDPTGRLVDVYRLPLGREPSHEPPCKPCTAEPLRVIDEDSLAGPCTIVAGKDFSLSIDHETGRLRRGVAAGQPLLLEWPTLHVLPTASPLAPLPAPETWQFTRLRVARDGKNVHASIVGRYPGFSGRYDVTIEPAGRILVDSSFEYTGNDLLAREVGLRFSVPADCNVLQWDRRAEWSVYPADHIGRPLGTARSFPVGHDSVPLAPPVPADGVPLAPPVPHAVTVHPTAAVVPPSGPTQPWCDDLSPMGTNDFRSTKRNIYWAAIHYPGGPGAAILSNGRQHVRAIVQTDRISVHVNDWYGGTNSGFPEWTTNYGEGKLLRKGDRVTSTVTLQLTPSFAQ